MRVVEDKACLTGRPYRQNNAPCTFAEIRVAVVSGAVGLMMMSLVKSAAAQEHNVMALAWLSFGGAALSSEAILSSYTVLPIAFEHFNSRNGSVLPWLSDLECNSTLKLVGGTIYDD